MKARRVSPSSQCLQYRVWCRNVQSAGPRSLRHEGVGLQKLIYNLTDWLLYWQASEEAEAGRVPTRTNNAKPSSSPQTTPSPSSNFYTNDATKSESDTSPSSPTHRPLTPLNFNLDTDIEPAGKKPFAYWPQVIFLGLVLQLLTFAFQFDTFHRRGLPGFVARWPVIYAITAPANTGVYLIGVVRLAPARWPVLRKGRFVELGEMCVWCGWVVWSLGVWWVVRGW
jgi:hypothetical protein